MVAKFFGMLLLNKSQKNLTNGLQAVTCVQTISPYDKQEDTCRLQHQVLLGIVINETKVGKISFIKILTNIALMIMFYIIIIYYTFKTHIIIYDWITKTYAYNLFNIL